VQNKPGEIKSIQLLPKGHFSEEQRQKAGL
jgi:hypothetical protein